MILDSKLLITMLVLAIIFGFIFSSIYLLKSNPRFSRKKAKRGFLTFLIGLWFITLIFPTDLFVMNAITLFIPEAQSMELMEFLNINYTWLIVPTGALFLFAGLVLVITRYGRNFSLLEKSQEQFRMLAENASDIITLRDENSKVIYLSPSFEKYFGLNSGSEIGKQPWKRMLAKDYPEIAKEWFKAVYKNGKPYKAEFYLKTTGGKYKWFDNHSEPVKDDAGKVVGSLTISRDITKRKIAEEKLKILADNASDIIVLHGSKGEISYVSPALKKHLGIDPEEVIGKQTIGVVHPEDKKNLSKHWNQRVLIEGKSLHKDIRFRNKEGDYLWFECHTQPVKGEKGKVIAAVTTSRNITEYKKAEAESLRLGRIVEDSLNEIFVFDTKTLEFLSVNRGARENLGYSLKELQSMTPLDIKPKYTKKQLLNLMKPLLSGKTEMIYFETVHRRKDGTFYDVGVSLQLSKTEINPVFVAIAENITDIKAAAEKLRQAQKMEAIGNLTGGVAHDFNNLLTAILGSLQYLKMTDETLSKEAQELIDIAIKSGQRGADLTRRLLAFSRKQNLKPTVVEVNGLVRNLLPLLRRTIHESIEIETRLTAQAFVEVDEGELENSLLNLAVNARDAMPKGGYLVFEVAKEKLTKPNTSLKEITPGDYVVISVSDNGQGMAPEVRDHVFEPFYTTKDLDKGTGLGLSSVYGFIKQSGGHVTVYSEPGSGTTFKLYLKATKIKKSFKPRRTKPADIKTKATGTILLVEDDKGLRKLIARALRGKGVHSFGCRGWPKCLAENG